MSMLPQAHPPADLISAEIAIVGSGPGGAVTGMLLAQAGRDVVMLEEGAHVEVDAYRAFSPEEMHAKLRNNGMTMALGPSPVAFWEARCVGGGSEVNRGLYHRPSPEVIAAWAERQSIEALSPEDMTDLALEGEKVAKISTLPGPAPKVSLKLAEGAEAMGWSHMEVPRLYSYGADWQSAPQPGLKQSMSATYIPAFVAAGGRLQTGIRVTGLRRENGIWRLKARARGIWGQKTIEIRAKTVFIACGATQTPALLRRSGIKRHVGDSLAYHSMIKVVARFDEEITGDTPLDPVHQVKHFDPRFSLGASVSNPATTAFALSDRPDLLPRLASEWRHWGCYYAQSTGGMGTVRRLPGFEDPLIRAKDNPQDIEDLSAGLRALCECLFAAGAQAIYPNIQGAADLYGPQDLARLPRRLDPATVSLSTLHLTATCPMGAEDRGSVCDSFGRVWGAEDLYLADSAMLPGPTVVNPQGTIMAMARRNMNHFLH
ncbi:MAG: GMC family oxidoreductase [Mangrovicoccus sp.]|nr:GMC family oxidoreductase [Mangrovicoccus sp.]